MKILWVSDCPDNRVHTGYATATRLIAVELMDRGHTFVFGSQGSQEANVMDIQVGKYTCKSYGFGRGKFLSGQAIGEIDMLEKPDLIVTMADWQMVEGMMGLTGHAAFSKWICYAPVDGDMLSSHWDTMIHNVPYMVYMSPKFGQQVCARRYFGYSAYVPLPLDLSQHWLMPKSEQDALKVSCKSSAGWSPDTLTVLTVARNQWRKNYPEIIKAAKTLRETLPGRFSFVFHCKPVEPMGWDLPKLIQRYGVEDCVAISDRELNVDGKNMLYNSADLFLLPSLGEGFGIPIIEAALYKLPIFTTDDTAGRDLTELIKCSDNNLDYEVSWQSGPTIPRPLVTGATIAKALAKYLDDGPGYDLAESKHLAEELFTVKRVCDSWELIFKSALDHREMCFVGGKHLKIGELSV